MHSKLMKQLLIAMMIALPIQSNAAETAPAVPAAESKIAAPAPAAVVATPTPVAVPAVKPVETAVTIPGPKLGYVDIARIAGDSDRGKALKAQLTAKKDALQAKIDGRKKQIEKFKASIEAKLPLMMPQQREAKSKEFQKKLEDFQKFARSSEEELYKLQEKETKSLYEDMEKAAADHGKANNFAVIVVKKELLYVGNSVDAQDVTDAVIKALNAAGPKK